MNKATGTLVVGIAGLILVLLAWNSSKIAPSGERVELQFRRATSFDYNTVRDCLKFGNGSRVFRKYKKIDASFRGPPDPVDASTYIDPNGSMFMLDRKSGQTLVQFKSAHPPSVEQKDLLEWCVENPSTTWISSTSRPR